MASGNGKKTRDDEAESRKFIEEIKVIADRLLDDRADRGDIKLVARALSELRESFALFARFRDRRKVTIFGSARTPADSPVYQLAVEFGRAIVEAGYMVITGAGPGIMEAGHVGAGVKDSIGINILLPFEQSANSVIHGDEKLLNLKYFFTRKLMFVKETDGIVLFPGGFGTLDEGFETLTMVQTGKSPVTPIVMMDTPGGTYWSHFDTYVRQELLNPGLISPEDLSLYKITTSVGEAVDEIARFYRVYHSQRYVRGQLVIRLKSPLPESTIERLNDEYQSILTHGRIKQGVPHDDEQNEPTLSHLPRLNMAFDRRSFGRLRQLIDVVNESGSPIEETARISPPTQAKQII